MDDKERKAGLMDFLIPNFKDIKVDVSPAGIAQPEEKVEAPKEEKIPEKIPEKA